MEKNKLNLRGSAPKRDVREKGFFSAEDGTALYYEVQGEGRPLILCYGLTCRREHWRHQVAYFSQKYQVITLDYRGHHASDRPKNDRNLTIDWCGRDVTSLIRHLKLSQVVLMGHSMGVPVVLRAIQRTSANVAGAVFVCGAVNDPFEHMFFTRKFSHVYRVYSLLYEWAPELLEGAWRKFTDSNRLSYFLTSRFGFNPSHAQEEDVLGYMQGVRQTPLMVFYSLISDYTKFDGESQLASIPCPTLVIAGEYDCITPFHLQERMAKLLPKGELFKVRFGSHNAHTDFPDRVNEAISGFLKKVHY